MEQAIDGLSHAHRLSFTSAGIISITDVIDMVGAFMRLASPRSIGVTEKNHESYQIVRFRAC
jgi:hypothetical protein